jgi:hypothetical protein
MRSSVAQPQGPANHHHWRISSALLHGSIAAQAKQTLCCLPAFAFACMAMQLACQQPVQTTATAHIHYMQAASRLTLSLPSTHALHYGMFQPHAFPAAAAPNNTDYSFQYRPGWTVLLLQQHPTLTNRHHRVERLESAK